MEYASVIAKFHLMFEDGENSFQKRIVVQHVVKCLACD